jgi:cell division protein FtsZ
MEAAQEAISSPLLDNVTIEGAGGVLINITGGMDLTIDEVTTIASIIQEAAGEEAEIIFGAVHDPSMEGEVRVTVIATGLERVGDQPVRDNLIRPNFGTTRTVMPAAGRPQRAVAADPSYAREAQPAMAGAGAGRNAMMAEAMPFPRPPQAPIARHQVADLDIPTFIRRQMD